VTTLFISHSSKDKAWSQSLREALRERGYQSLFLDFHPDDGIAVGADWEQTLYQNLRKCRGVVALCTPHWFASPWCVTEAMMARERGKPVFLLAAEGSSVPDFLKDLQFIGLSGLGPQPVLDRLLRGLREAGISDDFPLPDRPYPGLDPFTENDAAIFFGRDSDFAGVLERLRQRLKNNAKGFVVVLGASGCGKSSLVRAGVLPRLCRTVESPQEWVIAERFTGAEGLDGLARSLGKLLGKPPARSDKPWERPQTSTLARRPLHGRCAISPTMSSGVRQLLDGCCSCSISSKRCSARQRARTPAPCCGCCSR